MSIQKVSTQMVPKPEGPIQLVNPKISVIVPVKNREKAIGKCLDALLSQSLIPFEIIIVDGHSTDNTIKEIKKYPVKLVYENYGTVGGARQVGLEHAQGEYIAYTDSDCIPQTTWLENLVKGLDNETIGVGGGAKTVGHGLWEKTIAIITNTFIGSANSIQGRLFKKKKKYW